MYLFSAARARAATVASLLLVIASGSAALAQGTPADSATKVGAVIVTATRAQTTLAQMPLHTSVITRNDIAEAPAQTLDQLLRDISGMNVSGAPYYTTDPTGHQTKMRGVTNSKVLVLVDGVPVHDPFFVTTQWFKVPLSQIERVEVLRGGSSSTWGNLAVAGVVNIITRKPFDNDGQVDINYQSLNTLNVALWKNFMAGHGLSFRVSADRLTTDGYQTTPTAYLSAVPGKGTSSARNQNYSIAAYYNPNENVSAFVRAGYHEQNQDIGGYGYGRNLQKNPDASAGLTRIFNEHARADVRLWGQYVSFDKFNGAGCFLASASNCNTTATTSPLVQYANSHDDNPYREYGGSATVSFSDLGSVLTGIQSGVDFRAVSGADHALTYNKPTTTDISSATINRANFGQGAQQFIGLFTQLSARFATRLSATLSLRVDHWGNTDGIAQLTKYTNGAAGTPVGGPVPDSHEDSFNPGLSLRYDLGGGLSLRGAAYKAFRAPGLNNLYRSFSSTTSITIANPTLSPETLTGGEVGADLQRGPLTLGATWFQYNTQGLIASYKIQNAASEPALVTAVCGPTLSNCPATVNLNTNSQNSLSEGLELTGNWDVTPDVGLNATYTITDSHYTSTTTGDPIDQQLGAIPRDLGIFGVTWRITSKWNSFASVRWTEKMYLDVNGTIPQPSFTLINVSTSYRFDPRVELYGSVTNLGNVQYVDNGTTSASSETLGLGRAVTTGIRWRF